MNVAEAFQQVYDVNEKNGIETGISVCLGMNGVRAIHGHNEGKEFQVAETSVQLMGSIIHSYIMYEQSKTE